MSSLPYDRLPPKRTELLGLELNVGSPPLFKEYLLTVELNIKNPRRWQHKIIWVRSTEIKIVRCSPAEQVVRSPVYMASTWQSERCACKKAETLMH